MSKATGLNFETIENAYDHNLNRVDTGILEPARTVSLGTAGESDDYINRKVSGSNLVKDSEESKSIKGQDLENLWISSWIKSRNFRPGSSGFIIDGKRGYIECGDLKVRGVGEIGGWNIDATRIYSDDNDIVLDSKNKRIEIGSGSEIILDGVNKKITVGASNPIIIDGANKKIESDNYVSGYAGSGFHLDEDLFEVGNIACRGIFRSAVMQFDNTFAFAGNQIIAKGADVLKTTMTVADNSTVEIENDSSASAWAVGDILRLKDANDTEWFEITAVNGNVYTCNRDKKGDYGAGANPAWENGQAVENWGQSGDGLLYSTASEANAPYMSILTHGGEPWLTSGSGEERTTRLRIGNLNGYLGYSTDLYGIGIGDATQYLKYDPTNGMTIEGGAIRTSASGERILMYNDIIAFYDSNDKFRTTSNSGYIGFWDENEVASGSISSSATDLYILGNNDIFLSANTGSGDFYVSGDFIPLGNNVYDLGASVTKWKDLYISGNIIIDGTVDGINIFSHASSASAHHSSTSNGLAITPSSISCSGQINMNSSNKIINLATPTSNYDAATKKYVDDNTGASGANTALSNLSSVAINTSLLPTSDDDYNLGSSTKKWHNLYLGGGASRIYFGTGYIYGGGNFSFTKTCQPNTSNSYDLGTASYNWRHLYLDRNIYMDTSQYIFWGSDYIYCNGSEFRISDDLRPTSNESYYLGTSSYKWLGGNFKYLNIHGTGGSSSVQLGGDGGTMTVNGHFCPSNAGVKHCGTATNYWDDVNYKDLVDRGCLGWFDDGVELQNGKIVSDIEAIKAIKKHPNKKTKYGVPMLDYKTFPKVSYRPAENKKEMEGVGMTPMFSIMLGAFKELSERIDKLENKIK